MWSDDGTGNQFGQTSKAWRKVGHRYEATVSFQHAAPTPPSSEWFALLWPHAALPGAQADLSGVQRTQANVVEGPHIDIATCAFLTPTPGTYRLVVGYGPQGTTPGMFCDFGQVVVT